MLRLSVVFIFLYSFNVCAQTVVIATNEWFPMIGKPGNKPPGYMIELAEKTFSKVDIKLMPWKRAIEEVNAGRIDCVLGTDKRESPNLVFPAESWGIMQANMYVRADDDWVYTGINSLLSRRVGLVDGYVYSDEINQRMHSNSHVFKLSTGNNALEKNIKQMMAGRIDVVIDDIQVLQYKFKQLGVTDSVRWAGYVDEAIEVYIGCSPSKASSKSLIEQVDKATRSLRASGELQGILDRYGLTDWKKH